MAFLFVIIQSKDSGGITIAPRPLDPLRLI